MKTSRARRASVVSWALVVAAAALLGAVTPAARSRVASDTAVPGAAREYRVTSLAELQARIAAAQPGDRIIVANGVYTTTGSIKVACRGTADRPVVIAAETTGGVEIRGAAGFDVVRPAAHVVLQGFRFTHAIGTVQVRAGTRHCRITRCVFQLKGKGRYLLVSGDDCEIDHNTFQNKRTPGPMFSIHGPGASGMAQRAHVHHNLFRDFTSIGQNGGETLQVGLSGKSLTNAHAVVEYNLFERCDGENETVSNKSCANVYRYNTFRDSVGELTLRHGNRCEVYGNFFLNTHGLRFFGDDHDIRDNYFERCDPAVQIGNGGTNIPPGVLTGHDRPDRVTFTGNLLVDNPRSVVMPDRANGMGALDLLFTANVLQADTGTLFTLGGPLRDARFRDNIVWGSAAAGDLPATGFRRVEPQLKRSADGVYRLSLSDDMPAAGCAAP
jgi:hypothetical protein